MLHRTASLQSRVEARLRGFRTPSIRILRKAIAGIDKAALAKPLSVPHSEPPSGLSIPTAWKNLNVPLAEIIEHQKAKNLRWKSLNQLEKYDGTDLTKGMSELSCLSISVCLGFKEMISSNFAARV
jgi:hypothetical protein